MDKLYTCCIILMVSGAGIRAESTAVEKTLYWKTPRNKIPNDSEDWKDDYKILLVKLVNNNSESYGINVIVSSKSCSTCDKILGLLMNEFSQSFLIINDIASSNHSVIRENAEVVPRIGYYKVILFLTENVDQFFQHFVKLRSRLAWNPRALHLIFTVEKPDDKDLEAVFKECWSFKVLNVGLLINNLEEAYTYNPYLKNGSEMREKVDNWSRLFYDKLKNMNGHLIPVMYVPFSSKNTVRWIADESRFKFFGIEYGYGMAFFDSVNATPGFVNLTNDEVLLYTNFTYRYKIWNNINFRDVELWLNGMPSSVTVRERIEQTYPVNEDHLRILVPKSDIKHPSLLEPFNNVTWTCVLMSVVTFAIYSGILYRFRGIADNAFLRTFGVFFGKNLAKREHGALEKFSFIIFTMSSVLLLSAYQGQLYGALTTVSHYPEIDTMIELSQKVKSIHTYRIIAEYLPEYVPSNIKVVAFGTGEFVDYMKIHRDAAYAFTNAPAEYTVKWTVLSQNGIPFYHLMKEPALSDFVTQIFPYGSPYLDKMNKVILACKEAGLERYWDTEADLDALLSGTILPNGAEGRTLKKLSLRTQLTGFYIWGFGLLVSSVCCVAEIYFHNNGEKFLLHTKREREREREVEVN